MEPRARAGKNVGKETFTRKEIASLLYAFGDVNDPLSDTIRVLDEIVTEFLEGICFEASRHAQVAGRQKLKFDDFEFALRRNPQYLGRVKTMIDKRNHIKELRKSFKETDEEAATLAKDHAKDGAHSTAGAASRVEDLGDLDDDEAEEYLANTATSSKGTGSRKRKRAAK
ncbi:TFIID-18kDa-domain-containing protein [Hypoxylon fuscum]|nr:TFIID-18kDa-domain-containing protein [Hypoxylon fuscum]